MRIALANDHAGTALKNEIAAWLQSLGHEVVDFPSEDPIYANVAVQVAEYVVDGHADRGVLVCGTGIGVSIAANKVRGAYCACVTDVYQAQRATLSNNANLISMGSQVLGVETAKVLLGEYLGHEFDAGSRSAPKVARIREFEAQ